MNSSWNNFVREERNRVVEPGPYFVQRVMARLAPMKRPTTLWDAIPDAMRPVAAVALTVLFAVLAVQILVPVEPSRGAIEAYVGQDLTPRERMLFTDPNATAGAAQFEELMLLEPEQ